MVALVEPFEMLNHDFENGISELQVVGLGGSLAADVSGLDDGLDFDVAETVLRSFQHTNTGQRLACENFKIA